MYLKGRNAILPKEEKNDDETGFIQCLTILAPWGMYVHIVCVYVPTRVCVYKCMNACIYVYMCKTECHPSERGKKR
jgi:hypothetical protein